MHDHAVDSPHGGTARHEPTDIQTRPLRIAAIIGGIGIIAICVVLFFLFKYFQRTATQPDRELVESQIRSAVPAAPEPRIQGVPAFHGNGPRADMDQFRRESQQRLNSYGKSQEQGYVRIPIDRAMQILAERQMKPTTQKAQ
jgi:hypothetical protein